jgi:hypothetical protein
MIFPPHTVMARPFRATQEHGPYDLGCRRAGFDSDAPACMGGPDRPGHDGFWFGMSGI